MALKLLNQFVKFDIDGFLTNKTLEVVGIYEWKEFGTDNILGTKVELAIVKDNTQYDSKNGEKLNNKYEKLTVKVTQKPIVSVGDIARIENVTKANVFGDYRNQLSIEAQAILPAQTFKKEG